MVKLVGSSELVKVQWMTDVLPEAGHLVDATVCALEHELIGTGYVDRHTAFVTRFKGPSTVSGIQNACS